MATTEVAEVLGLVDFVQEVNVYGVEVPGMTNTHVARTCADGEWEGSECADACAGQEGRAGMAAVITRPGSSFDGKKLFEHAMSDLPVYARPLFIRLQVSARQLAFLP